MTNMPTNTVSELDFQNQLIAFIRAFGLHKPEETPCGQPISVAEAHALVEITHNSGLSQNDLAACLSLEKSTVSRLAQQLVERGWVERRPHPDDRRVRMLYLTPAGETMMQDLAAARQAKFTSVLAAIPPDKQSTILEALALLTEAMRESSEQTEP